MFTSDALQQMAADRRSRMMAQASAARTVRAAAGVPGSPGRSRRRQRVPLVDSLIHSPGLTTTAVAAPHR